MKNKIHQNVAASSPTGLNFLRSAGMFDLKSLKMFVYCFSLFMILPCDRFFARTKYHVKELEKLASKIHQNFQSFRNHKYKCFLSEKQKFIPIFKKEAFFLQNIVINFPTSINFIRKILVQVPKSAVKKMHTHTRQWVVNHA